MPDCFYECIKKFFIEQLNHGQKLSAHGRPPKNRIGPAHPMVFVSKIFGPWAGLGWAGLGWAGLGVGWPSPSGALVSTIQESEVLVFPFSAFHVTAVRKISSGIVEVRGPQEIKLILVYFSTILYEQWLDASPLVPPVLSSLRSSSPPVPQILQSSRPSDPPVLQSLRSSSPLDPPVPQILQSLRSPSPSDSPVP